MVMIQSALQFPDVGDCFQHSYPERMHKTDENFLREIDFRVDFLKFNSLKLCETFDCVCFFDKDFDF